jgi:hypothetical protein
MDAPRSDCQNRFDYSWLDLEFVLYGIVGLVLVALGARALAHWVMSEWAAGARALPGLVLFAVGTKAVALLLVVRSRKRWFYLGAAFAAIALITLLLATVGVSIPAGWLQ